MEPAIERKSHELYNEFDPEAQICLNLNEKIVVDKFCATLQNSLNELKQLKYENRFFFYFTHTANTFKTHITPGILRIFKKICLY